MSNSNKKTSSKSTSFNKSKSKSISDAMKDLEMAKPVSKVDSDFSETTNDIVEEESIHDEYLEIDNSDIDFDVESEKSILASKMEGINLEDLEKASSNSDVNTVNTSESDIDDLLNDIFVSPNDGVIENNVDNEGFNQENNEDDNEINDLINGDDELILSKPKPKSKFKSIKSSSKDVVDLSKSDKSAESSSKDSVKFFNAIKSRFTVKSLRSIFSSRSKILALLGIIIGLIIIIYGIMSFSNVSDRVVDHVLLGEAGSWSIFIILFGLIIILLDVFFVFYYKQYLRNSSVNNLKLKSTFDTIDKIKSIDSDYYEEDDFDDISLKDFFKGKQEKESPNNIKNSIFNNETIDSDSITVDADDSEFITVETVDDNDK